MIYTIDNRPAPIDWQTREYVGRTLQNAKNLLCAWAGEVPYDRLRGLDPHIQGSNYQSVKDNILAEAVRVMLWEPDAKVIAARVGYENGNMIVEVDVQIDGEG